MQSLGTRECVTNRHGFCKRHLIELQHEFDLLSSCSVKVASCDLLSINGHPGAGQRSECAPGVCPEAQGQEAQV